MAVKSFSVNDEVHHVVRFYARERHGPIGERRVVFEATVVAIHETQIEIKFRNGITKKVSPESLTKKES